MIVPRALLLVAVLAVEAAAVALLHHLGSVPAFDLGTLTSAGALPEDVVMAAARLVALGVAWWLLVTTGLYSAARLGRVPAALHAVEWATLPAVRRLVERTLAATLSLSAVALPVPAAWSVPAAAATAPVLPAPAAAAHAPVLPALVPAAEGGVVLPPGAGPLAGGPAPATPSPAAPAPAAAAADPLREHLVRPGEHLWGLAAAVVAEATGQGVREVAPAEVAAYWIRLVEANPSNLRSGDPNLVYPGETLRLPPVGG